MNRTITAFSLLLLILSALLSAACGGAGSLTLYDVNPPTLDPALARSGASIEYILEIFSGLVKLSAGCKDITCLS